MAQNDGRILLSKEEAQRKADEKASVIGITFERMTDGILETRVASSVEHIAAFFNSSDEGPNAKNKQDFGWRLAPEDLIELEDIKNDPSVMERIAAVYQIPAEDVADYNVLKYMASKRFKTAAVDTRTEERDYESDYAKRVRQAREGKSSTPVKKAEPKTPAAKKGDSAKTDNKVKTETDKPVAKSDKKPDNEGKDKQ